MEYFSALSILIQIFFSSPAFADTVSDSLAPQIFGIRMGMSTDDFRRRLSQPKDVLLNVRNKEIQSELLRCYGSLVPVRGISLVEYNFFSDKLKSIHVRFKLPTRGQSADEKYKRHFDYIIQLLSTKYGEVGTSEDRFYSSDSLQRSDSDFFVRQWVSVSQMLIILEYSCTYAGNTKRIFLGPDLLLSYYYLPVEEKFKTVFSDYLKKILD